MIILDLKGRILRRLYLPLNELIQNRETGKWELLITDLESIH